MVKLATTYGCHHLTAVCWLAKSKAVYFQCGIGQVSMPLKTSVAQLLLSDATGVCREARAGQCWGVKSMASGIIPAVFDGS